MTGSVIKATFDTLRVLAFGGISGTYAAVGSAFTRPVRLLKIYNGTDSLLRISLDGSTDNDMLPSLSGQIYDITSDKVDDGGFFIPTAARVYVKTESGSPSSGSVYVTVIGAAT
jgi:hypothetical protein